MPNVTISPNMSLPVPVVGQDPGPDWATMLNACLALIDQHNHSSGNGVPINPAGLNINADLPFNNNNLTTARSLRLQSQNSPLALPADVGCLYLSGVDLYFNDGSGNQIRVTQSGGIAGTPGSISNLTSPASAAYVGANQTFVWESDANTPANMDGGSILLRNIVANSKALTLSPPNAMGSNYALTLPSLPASQKIMTLDASGNMSAPYTVDNSTIAISTNVIGVPNGGITRPKLAAVGQQISGSSGNFTNSGTAVFVNLPNNNFILTTTGRPVVLGIIPSDPTNPSFIGIVSNLGSSPPFINLRILRDGVPLGVVSLSLGNAATLVSCPPPGLIMVDPVAAGTYEYRYQIQSRADQVISGAYLSLFAYEL